MTPDEQEAFINKHVGQIAEHFDCVQILVSRTNPDGNTETVFMGSGNWYARKGMADELLKKDLAGTFREMLHPDDDGDDWKNGVKK
jgi:hypothetical protein